jgi:hypothetical protein
LATRPHDDQIRADFTSEIGQYVRGAAYGGPSLLVGRVDAGVAQVLDLVLDLALDLFLVDLDGIAGCATDGHFSDMHGNKSR